MIKQEVAILIEESIKQLQKEKTLPAFKLPEFQVERPGKENCGDYATNVALKIAKNISRKPIEIAGIIKSKMEVRLPKDLKEPKIFKKIEVAEPGFINFLVSQEELERLFLKVAKEGIKAFQTKPKKKETIVIEYSSPNIAKPLGVHHLRSTIIGQTLVNILRFAGHKVISLSFPGDWGTQFGLLIAAYKKWGDKEKLKKNPIPEMLNLYIRFSETAKKDPKLLAEGRQEFKKLEAGGPENKKLWQWFAKESLKDFERIYKLLGVKIENTIAESFYEPELKSLVQEALKKGLAEKGEDNSIIVNLPNSAVPEIIQKSDGATIYTTRELAAIRHRLKKWQADKIIYVAANQQAFHLEQVFGCAEKLGLARKDQLLHVKFGMMLGIDGKKFATREGKLIPLEDVLKEALERAKKIIEKTNPSLTNKEKEEIARIVGVGAVKFFDLSRNRLSDIIFDWEQILNLRGFSAPYLQYTFTRLMSILKKGNFKKKKILQINITQPLEREVMLTILRFDEVIEEVSQTLFPNKLAEYLYGFSNVLNNFYESAPVLKAGPKEKETRLNLVFCSTQILKSGLDLLGISSPEKM